MNTKTKEALLVYVFIAVAIGGLVHIDVTWPFVGHVGSAMVAILLLYVPFYLAWRQRQDLSIYGFHLGEVKQGLWLSLVVILILLPLFAVAYTGFYEFSCDPNSWIAEFTPQGFCRRFRGWDSPIVAEVNPEFFNFVLVQLIVVALPEELFFRGYLQKTLEQAMPANRTILGVSFGWAIILSSLLFALIHFPKYGDFRSLATFFPALLFGWLRTKTGSIFAPTIVHASCNVCVHLLNQVYLK